MKVMRVEWMNGDGPYANMHFPYGIEETRRHPAPGNDGMSQRLITPDHKFGFVSIKQLRGWFTAPIREKLGEQNYEVVTYDVESESVIHGRHQVAFDSRRAIMMSRIPMSEL